MTRDTRSLLTTRIAFSLRARCRRTSRSLLFPRDPARRGGTVALDVAHGAEVAQGLQALDILCDYRPGAGIRLSPHFYNRDDELDDAIAAVEAILAWGA